MLCTKVLGLTEGHAWRTLSGSKTQGDIKQTLAAVTVEIEEERRRWQEKETAEEAVRIERKTEFGGRNGEAAEGIPFGRLKLRE